MSTKPHRQALAFAAMLTATVVAAIAAVGGLTRWNAPSVPGSSSPPVTSIVQHAPATSFTAEGDD